MTLFKRAGAVEIHEIDGVRYHLLVPTIYTRNKIRASLTKTCGPYRPGQVQERLRTALKKFLKQSGDQATYDSALAALNNHQALAERLSEPLARRDELRESLVPCEDPDAREALEKELAELDEILKDDEVDLEIAAAEAEDISEQMARQWAPYGNLLEANEKFLTHFPTETLRQLLQRTEGLEGGDILPGPDDCATEYGIGKIPPAHRLQLETLAIQALQIEETARKN